MTEVPINKTRRQVLEACNTSHGAIETKWDRDPLAKKAVAFLIEQKLLDRRQGDSGRAMVWRLHLTERGRAALRGDMISKI